MLRAHIVSLEESIAQRDDVLAQARQKIKQLLTKVRQRDALIKEYQIKLGRAEQSLSRASSLATSTAVEGGGAVPGGVYGEGGRISAASGVGGMGRLSSDGGGGCLLDEDLMEETGTGVETLPSSGGIVPPGKSVEQLHNQNAENSADAAEQNNGPNKVVGGSPGGEKEDHARTSSTALLVPTGAAPSTTSQEQSGWDDDSRPVIVGLDSLPPNTPLPTRTGDPPQGPRALPQQHQHPPNHPPFHQTDTRPPFHQTERHALLQQLEDTTTSMQRQCASLQSDIESLQKRLRHSETEWRTVPDDARLFDRQLQDEHFRNQADISKLITEKKKFLAVYTQQYKRLAEDIERERRNMAFDVVTLLDEERVVSAGGAGDEGPALPCLSTVGEEQGGVVRTGDRAGPPGEGDHVVDGAPAGGRLSFSGGSDSDVSGASREGGVVVGADGGRRRLSSVAERSPEFGAGEEAEEKAGAEVMEKARGEAEEKAGTNTRDMWDEDWSAVGTSK